MNPIVGILILLGVGATIGFGRVVAGLANALTAAGNAAAIGGHAIRLTAGTVAPYLRMAGVYGAFATLVAATLVAIGLEGQSQIAVVLGGLIIGSLIAIVFAAARSLAEAAVIAARAIRGVVGTGAHAFLTVLSWFGLATPRSQPNPGGGLPTVLPVPVAPATFRDRLRELKMKTFVVWSIIVSVLTVFPSWLVALTLIPTLFIVILAGGLIAAWRGYSIEVLWRTLWVLSGVTAVTLILSFVFAETFHTIRAEVLPDWDHGMRCAIRATTPDCRERTARALGEDLEEATDELEEAALKALPPPPLAVASGGSLPPPPAPGVSGSGGTHHHAPPPPPRPPGTP